jgi:dUTP pyrophosphatase
MTKSKLKLLKTREVKDPLRAHSNDAGIDFFVPKFDPDFIDQLIEKNPQLFGEDPDKVVSGLTFTNGSTLTTSSGNTLTINSGPNEIVSYNSINSVTKDDNELIGFDPKKGPYFLLKPHNRVMIPSGIKSRMATSDRALIAANKSGIATKHGLVFGAQVIDYSYTGEIHISVINTSTKILKIFEGQKLIQFIETPVFLSELVISDSTVTNTEEFYKGFDTDRKDGGFGHTG